MGLIARDFVKTETSVKTRLMSGIVDSLCRGNSRSEMLDKVRGALDLYYHMEKFYSKKGVLFPHMVLGNLGREAQILLDSSAVRELGNLFEFIRRIRECAVTGGHGRFGRQVSDEEYLYAELFHSLGAMKFDSLNESRELENIGRVQTAHLPKILCYLSAKAAAEQLSWFGAA